MKITLTFNPSELVGAGFKPALTYWNGARVVVIDVLRACSTITHALSQGCRAIYPFASVRGCLERARAVGRNKVLLGGERGGLRIKGFQLGNSPLEYRREVVEGKDILFTTTNCTKNLNTITRLGKPKEVLICSFLNLPAVADYLVGGMESSHCVAGKIMESSDRVAGYNDWVHLALSGTNEEVSLEDVVCGGMLIHRLVGAYGHTPLSDSARLAHVTYLHYKDNPHQALLDSTHGRRLIGLGMKRDIDFCGRVGIYDLVPRYSGGVIK